MPKDPLRSGDAGLANGVTAAALVFEQTAAGDGVLRPTEFSVFTVGLARWGAAMISAMRRSVSSFAKAGAFSSLRIGRKVLIA